MKIIWLPVAVLCVTWIVYFSLFPFEYSGGDRLAQRRWARYLLMATMLVLGLAIVPRLLGMLSILRSPQKTNGATWVWVNMRSGFYYCPGNEFYGRVQPGNLNDPPLD